MKIVISSGHGKYVRGAAGPAPWGLDEVDEARRVVARTAEILKMNNVPTKTFNDDVSKTQNENLNRIVDYHNDQTRDLDVSIHFNANITTDKPMGTECLYVSQNKLAGKVANGIADSGHFIDRGPKKRTDLFFLNNTDMPAILIEVCFVDSETDANLYRANFDAICAAIANAVSGVPLPPPRPPIPDERPLLGKGDQGPYVSELQKSLGVLVPDGDFGSTTDIWVRAFQAACGLGVDGMVGNATWAQVDALVAAVNDGDPRLPKELADEIYTMAQQSEIADYAWPDRGIAPSGYIAGMAMAFAYALVTDDEDTVAVMSKAQGNADKDALAWYAPEFAEVGMSNMDAGADTLRHLFVMQMGLGPRESSGRYCEGRDLTASNVEPDTAEAGLFQTSWNIRNANPAIGPLLDDFWTNPNGFLPTFKEGITATANNLNSYGSGDGVRYQFLSRFAPLFHVMVTAVGMRTLRQHWGPINRREVTIRKEADDLLKSVQKITTDFF